MYLKVTPLKEDIRTFDERINDNVTGNDLSTSSIASQQLLQ